MAVTTFAAPLLPGKTEDWIVATNAMRSRMAELSASNRRLGLTREVVSLQRTPMGDFVVVFFEGDDPNSIIQRLLESDDPFDKWFVQSIVVACHGISADDEPMPPNEVFVDWSA